MNVSYPRSRSRLARKLRREMTDAETCLWQRLRSRQMGVRFQRQRPIGPYIVDFYCPAARLVVEIDGSQHMALKHRENDRLRESWLEKQGLFVQRFDNRHVLLETASVLEAIRLMIEHRAEQ